MQRLSAADLTGALDFIRAASEEAGPAAFPVRVVEHLRTLLGCEWGSYCELDRGRRRALLLVESPVPDWAISEETFWRLAGGHVLCQVHARARFDALKLSGFLSRTALHGLEGYAEWLRPYGFEYELVVAIPTPPGHTETFPSDDRHDFGERERTLLDLLQPHLRQLYRAAAVRREARLARALVEADLDVGAHAVVVVDAHGGVQVASPRARHLLDRHFAGWTGTRLPAIIIEWLAARTRAGPAGRVPATLAVTGPSGTLRIDCAHAPADGVLVLGELAAGCTAGALTARERPVMALTSRERQVIALVGDGLRNREIAQALWVSPATIRKHLENIYDKLGVHTRTAAVARSRRAD